MGQHGTLPLKAADSTASVRTAGHSPLRALADSADPLSGPSGKRGDGIEDSPGAGCRGLAYRGFEFAKFVVSALLAMLANISDVARRDATRCRAAIAIFPSVVRESSCPDMARIHSLPDTVTGCGAG